MISTPELLLRMMDEAYEKKAWHGTNLRGTLRGISAGAAVWRPGAQRHNIAELVVHAADQTSSGEFVGTRRCVSCTPKSVDWSHRRR